MSELKSQHDARRTFATDCFYADMPLKNLQVSPLIVNIKLPTDQIIIKSVESLF